MNSASSGAASISTKKLIDDDPMLGSSKARVTVVEFSDYQCPACELFYTQIFTRMVAEYGDQVRFVFRDFPLTSIHPAAEPAAEAANCAREQDKYWEYHNALFSREYELSREGYMQIASALGLDTAAFTACFDSRKYADEIQADYDYGVSIGVNATPTFYVNGEQVVGVPSYESFKNMIDKILNGN